MSSPLVPKQGIDSRGRSYTRMVKIPGNGRASAPLSAPRNTARLSNEEYSERYLDVSNLESQGLDRLDFHDVSVASVSSMLNAVARDYTGSELSKDALGGIIHVHLWDADGNDLETQNSDHLDFHEVSVIGIKRAIESAKQHRAN
jgi:hypothetical protein